MRKNIEQQKFTLLYDACMHIRLVSDFETINKKIDFMSEISSEDFLPLNQKLRMYQKNIDALSSKDKLDKKIFASGAYTSISEIVRDMQFHDVIQQRLDHIRNINRSIIEELNEVSYGPSYLDKTKYVKNITLLAKINFVQIVVISYEYRIVIENLKKSLSSIDQLVTFESSASQVHCFNNVSLFNVLSETICNKLKIISEMKYPGKKNSNSTDTEEIEYVRNLYTMKTERDIFKRVKELSDKQVDIHTICDIIVKEVKESVSDNKYELF
jgi:hypothetical protein